MIDYRRTKGTPFQHQVVDTEALLTKPFYFLALEMGLGKSRIVVDAACALYERGEIDTLVVVCPASARSVWADPDPILGEFAKWVWDDVPHDVREYHAKRPLPPATSKLQVIVSNPEFIRRDERLQPLLKWMQGRKVMLVGDESWLFQNYKSAQTKAMVKMGKAAARTYLLNGTPGAPEHVFSQLQILPENIFDCRNYFVWRARYCKLGGYMAKNIVGYRNMDDFDRRTAPYVVRRLTRDCLDLPPVSYTQIEARLTQATWRHYCEIRDDLITWLSDNEVATAAQAGVRVLRLAQLTAGFLGGVEREFNTEDAQAQSARPLVSTTREVGREKLDAVNEWLRTHWPESNKIVCWQRFRAEIERAEKELALDMQPRPHLRKLYGGQTSQEREDVKRLFAPGGDPAPAILVGTPQAGAAGLNFAAANVAIYMTNSFSLKDRLQSEGRLDRPGQTRPVLYVDVLAVGPEGRKTVDHHIVSMLRKKQDVNDMTAAAWRQVLEG